jgi:hypothetical protein
MEMERAHAKSGTSASSEVEEQLRLLQRHWAAVFAPDRAPALPTDLQPDEIRHLLAGYSRPLQPAVPAPAALAAGKVVVCAAVPAGAAAAQVVVGAAVPAGAAAAPVVGAQVVVRRRPISEVDLGDVPGRQQRLKLLHAAFLEEAATFAEAFPDKARAMDRLASDVLDPLAFEKEKLALEQAKLTLEKEQLTLEKEKLTLEKEKLAVKANEFALRKKQDEWDIEKKERMQRNDRWHQHQISRNSI